MSTHTSRSRPLGPTPLEDRYGAQHISDGVSHNYIRAECNNCGHCYRTNPGKSHAETCTNCDFPVRLVEDQDAYALPGPYNYTNVTAHPHTENDDA